MRRDTATQRRVVGIGLLLALALFMSLAGPEDVCAQLGGFDYGPFYGSIPLSPQVYPVFTGTLNNFNLFMADLGRSSTNYYDYLNRMLGGISQATGGLFQFQPIQINPLLANSHAIAQDLPLQLGFVGQPIAPFMQPNSNPYRCWPVIC